MDFALSERAGSRARSRAQDLLRALQRRAHPGARAQRRVVRHRAVGGARRRRTSPGLALPEDVRRQRVRDARGRARARGSRAASWRRCRFFASQVLGGLPLARLRKRGAAPSAGSCRRRARAACSRRRSSRPAAHDPARPRVTARRDGAGWRLDGVKECVPAGTLAALLLVPAQTPDGVGVFLVEPGGPGVRARAPARDEPRAAGAARARRRGARGRRRARRPERRRRDRRVAARPRAGRARARSSWASPRRRCAAPPSTRARASSSAARSPPSRASRCAPPTPTSIVEAMRATL